MAKFNLEAELWRQGARATALEILLVHFMEALVLSGQISASIVHSTFDEALTSVTTAANQMTGTASDVHLSRVAKIIGDIRKTLQLPE